MDADNKAVAQTSGSTDNPLLEEARQMVQEGQFPAIYAGYCPFSYKVYAYSSIRDIEKKALAEGNILPWEQAVGNSVNETEIKERLKRDSHPNLVFGVPLVCVGAAAAAEYVSLSKGKELAQLDTPAVREGYEAEAGDLCLGKVYKDALASVDMGSPEEMVSKGIHIHADMSQEQVVKLVRECVPVQTQMIVDTNKEILNVEQDAMTFGAGLFSSLTVAFLAAGAYKYFRARNLASQALETLAYIKGVAEEQMSGISPS